MERSARGCWDTAPGFAALDVTRRRSQSNRKSSFSDSFPPWCISELCRGRNVRQERQALAGAGCGVTRGRAPEPRLSPGAVMAEAAARLLGVRLCRFVPRHARSLANEFRCYVNYESGLDRED